MCDHEEEFSFKECVVLRDLVFKKLSHEQQLEVIDALYLYCQNVPVIRMDIFGIFKYKAKVSKRHVELFFDNPGALKANAADYYHVIVKVAKTICKVGRAVCPYIDKLPD